MAGERLTRSMAEGWLTDGRVGRGQWMVGRGEWAVKEGWAKELLPWVKMLLGTF